MKYTLGRSKDGVEIKKFEVEFNVKHFYKLSKKDEEKIYRIVRIIDSLGSDEVDETSDKDYRFQTDQDDGKDMLKGVVEDGNVKEKKSVGDDIDLKSVYKTERV